MILRDPIHGLVSFESEEESVVVELLETAEVQRLRRIRQLGLSNFAYPGADHSRFSHAIGATFVMKELIRRLRAIDHELPFWQRMTTERARDALAAALLHDIGHGPFSHLFEEAVPGAPRHETWTSRILADPSTEVHGVLQRFDSSLPARVADLVHGRHELSYLARAVSGTFDVDRCDYLLRDAHFTGVSYGNFDLAWLLRSLRFGVSSDSRASPSLAIDGEKGLPAIESFVLARLFMFQQVYFHKTSRASEWMLARVLARVGELLADGTRVPGLPKALDVLIRDNDCGLSDYLTLDDNVLWVALRGFQDASDPLLSDLARRLCSRRLFKTIGLYAELAQPHERQRCLEIARDLARAQGLHPNVHVGIDAASDQPFEDQDESLSVVYPGGRERRPREVSFLLGRLSGERLECVRLIVAPELRDAVTRAIEP